MKWLLLTIFISVEDFKPPSSSIREFENFMACEKALININNIEKKINGNKAELFKDKSGFIASRVIANNKVKIYRYCTTAVGIV